MRDKGHMARRPYGVPTDSPRQADEVQSVAAGNMSPVTVVQTYVCAQLQGVLSKDLLE